MGDITLLLDCGVDEEFSESYLRHLSEVLKTQKVDYVLLSSSYISQCGAIPFLQAKGLLEGVKIMTTSPVNKMAYLQLFEYFIQRKELGDFKLFTLHDVDKAFEHVELVSYNEHRKIRSQDTELIISAHPSGSAMGGAAWNIEYNKQLIVYAVDMNDTSMSITMPMMKFADFKNANILITNAYLSPKMQLLKPATVQGALPNSVILPAQQKCQRFLSEEKLRLKLERVLVDIKGQILIPVSDKN